MSVLKDIIIYSEGVLKDKPFSCKKHKWACKRFLDDLETNNFDYVFDDIKAQKVIKWAKQFKHRKGVLAGQYINPAPIQKFILGNIYGWVNKDNGLRRFNKGYWQVARKNAKSQLLSIMGSYELSALGEKSSEVYSAGTKREQAKIVWNDCQKMLLNSKYKDKFRVAYNTIFYDKTDSIFRTLSKDDKISGDGLNPQFGIIDEYHAHVTDEYYEILESGMMARSQPLMFIITTAGFELNNPCYRVEYKLVSDILNPYIDIWNDEYFILINELEKNEEGDIIDDVMNPDIYIKANPIIATYPEGMKNLISKAKTAKDSPLKWRKFLTKNMNVWINMTENKYMIDEKFALCCVKESIYNIVEKRVYIGVDLSSTIDLTSITMVWFEKDILHLLNMSFIPEESLYRKVKEDNAPYDRWVEEGYIVLTNGAEVDYFDIKDWILNFCKKQSFEIEEICFDNWNATMFAKCMEREGITTVDISQTYGVLSEPTKKFRAMIYNKKVIIYNNPCFSYAVANAIEKMDKSGNIMLDKEKSIKRIDPIASAINAVTRALYDYNSEDELEIHIIDN